MDLLCNEEMAERIYNSDKKVIILRNGRKMVIYHKAVVVGCIKDVWFDKTATTTIFSFKNLIQ